MAPERSLSAFEEGRPSRAQVALKRELGNRLTLGDDEAHEIQCKTQSRSGQTVNLAAPHCESILYRAVPLS